MIVTVTAPRERPSLVAKMADGYLAAAVFALDSWAESAHLVEQRGADVRENGAMAAYGRAVLQREFWQDEADRVRAAGRALGRDAAMSFSQEAVRARALEVRRERAVSVELLVLAFRRSGMSAGDVARVLGWKRTTKGYRVADSGRVYRYLGVKPTPGTRGYPSRYREFINYEAALAIAEAIGVDPVDVGL